MKTRTSSLLGDQSGVVLIEFAMIAPFLILLFLSGFNLASGMALARKAATAAHAVADLAAQPTMVTKANLDEILSTKDDIVAPFKLNDKLARITQVKTNGLGVAKVEWSYAKTGAALQKGRPYDLPLDFQLPNITYIITDLEYEYRYQGDIVGAAPMPLSESVIVLPRQSQEVTCSDC